MVDPEMTSAATVIDPRDGPAAQGRHPWLETSLDTTRSCIRILKVRKGSGVMPIICDLNVASLDDHPHYEALSYVWGDPKVTRDITVGGVNFTATANLFDFLHSLRSPTADRYLWADAICIDQTNEEEKIYQIGLMTKIYQYAKEAHIWFGPFTKDWDRKMAGDKEYILLGEMTPNMWNHYERICWDDLKYFKEQDGFKPLSRAEFQDFERRCSDDIFLQTLTMLDRMGDADGKAHHYTYPVFVFDDEKGGDGKYGVNIFWLRVMDCIRWLLTRPWWTRVWTLQEAVLPRIDPTVHAPPYSFKLSRLINGIHSMLQHNGSTCCKWFGRIILTQVRDYEKGSQFTQPLAIYNQRESLKDPREGWIPLEQVVESIQGRKATGIRDHWFGIFGFLPPDWQEADKSCTGPWSTAELFTKCSKLLYGDCKELTMLDMARRLRESKVPDLPSWAIDLSAQRTEDETDYKRWMLYDATKGTEYEGVQEWPELKTPDLTIKARRVGTVFVPGEQLSSHSIRGQGQEEAVLQCVKEWHELYHDNIQPTNDDAFWRAVFMDRDIWRHWMHKRTNPLYKSRITGVSKWFHNWRQTGDERDLDTDKKAGGSTRGDYSYRALEMNVTKTKFFIMADGVPGMGPHEIQAEDEVFAVAGCKSLAVLRRGKWNGMDCFTFVGLCFVDGWMYGRATLGHPNWETLLLY
ncbi:hypothetical protein K505DRAFT_324342 [Melanomma pulvis-pyrius CBS 109.77]|uniref:Heterokaryon incompatibility domain-containing protein n=1 Tax=Melanomma pulvis-pyrius CBS 109.77 TaxID=1314802 RepID=A0A6A6XFX3_9PLEO|nr:hypothetical protein K505DRAFT_324342 [Melanomma pulvis-pyrius CBS 109.77]